MTPHERARQIDQEEFRRDSEQALNRALAYSRHKQEARRRQFLILAFGDQGKHMDLDKLHAPADDTTTTLPTYRLAGKQIALTASQWASRLKITDSILSRKAEELGSVQAALEHFNSKAASKASRPAARFEHNGLTLTADEWGDRLGISASALYQRAKTLGSMSAAIEQGSKRQGRTSSAVTHNGLSMTRHQWAEHLGLTYQALYQRIHKHGIHAAIAMGGQRTRGRKPANDNAEPTSISIAQPIPGVSLDLQPMEETGAWSLLQETPEITFSDKAKTA